MKAQAVPRYDRVAIALHWLIGVALLLQIAFGFLLDEIAPRNTPERAGVINLHKSIGITLGVLIVLRLIWRIAHSPPPLPAGLPRWQRTAAHWNQWALYACMVLMPSSGYIASNFSKYGVKFFGISFAPWGPQSKAVYEFFNGVHVVTAFVFAGLITLHIAAALKHAFIERDHVVARMWPPTNR